MDELIEFALNLSSWCFLPTNHKCNRYTGPLFRIMGLRAQEMGSRLAHLTVSQYSEHKWGYVKSVAQDFSKCVLFDGTLVDDLIPQAMYAKANDWKIEDNYSTKVAIVSASLGYCQSINRLMKAAGKPGFPDDEAVFEKPDACNDFPEPRANAYDDMMDQEQAEKDAAKKAGPQEVRQTRDCRKTKPKVAATVASSRPMPANARPARFAKRPVDEISSPGLPSLTSS